MKIANRPFELECVLRIDRFCNDRFCNTIRKADNLSAGHKNRKGEYSL